MTTDNTPWEVGLGFTVSRSKENFRGKAALMPAEAKPKIANVGLDIDHSDMVEGGEQLSLNGETVGIVNSPAYSHRLGKSLALAHITPGIAVGTVLDLKSDDFNTTATVVSMPIYDPSKSRTHE